MHKLGVPEKWMMQDVWSLDPDCIETLQKPILSIVLLFPCTDEYYKFRDQQFEDIKTKGQTISPNVYYMKQVVPNACGTVALIHGVANKKDQIELTDGHLKTFIEDSKDLDPIQKGELLEKAENIINLHKEIACGGQTEAPAPECPVNYHFVAFTEVDGCIYELDGRKEFPINHGPISDPNMFLEDAIKICKGYIERQPDTVTFSVVALGPA